jgi:RNA polymerase sigma-70 factor (ECF subfamily)
MNVLRKRAFSLGFATVPVAPREASARDMGDRGTIERALRGDGVAVRALVELLTPAIQTSIARVLLRSGARLGRDVRSEVADLTQEVFERLFAEDGRLLRDWEPERGASLAGFVKIVAERHALSVLRSRRRSPFAEEAREVEALDRGEARSLERGVRAAARDVERTGTARVRALVPRGARTGGGR